MMIVMRDRPARSTDDDESFGLLGEAATGEGADHRSLTGFVVIALAVIAIAVVAVGRGRTVAGVAVVPPRPQIGDCVSTEAVDQVWDTSAGDRVPVLVSAPCTGSRAGEVVSVEDRRASSQGDCWSPALDYLGLPASRSAPQDPNETVWSVRWLTAGATFGPSPLQVAAGQVWSACVLMGVDVETVRPFPLTESPRGAAARGGAAFDRFVACADTPLSPTFVPCGMPHRYEIVADGFDLGASEAASLESCRGVVSDLTGLQDPSAGGRLRVELASYFYDPADDATRPTNYQRARSSGGGVSCAVSAADRTEMLTSTLVGVGDRPLPIS